MRRRDPKGTTDFSDLDDMPISDSVETARSGAEQREEEFRAREARLRRIATLRRLWVSRHYLVKVIATGFLVSTLVAFVIPKRYESVARLMPPDNQSGSGGLAMAAQALTGAAGSVTGGLGGLGGLAGDLLGQKTTSDLLAGVLESRSVEDKLIQDFNLKKVYHVQRIEDARKNLESQTDITVDHKNQIITLTVTDKNPQRATAMAQAYVDELNRALARVSTSEGRRERMFLEGRLKTVTENLETAEKQFSQFASKNATLDIRDQSKATVDAAASLEGQLIAARSELEGLRQIYTDDNVRVRSAEARVAELDKALRRLSGENPAASTRDSGDADALYPSLRDLPILGVPYADLYRRMKVEEAVFEMLTEKYEMAKLQEAKEVATVRVLDYPKPPEKKSFPPRTILIILGTLLSFAAGVAWLLGWDKWEQTDPGDPAKMLAQEVFDAMKATIPWTARNGHGVPARDPRAAGSLEPPEGGPEKHR